MSATHDRARHLAVGSAGSERLVITKRNCAGRFSMTDAKDAMIAGLRST